MGVGGLMIALLLTGEGGTPPPTEDPTDPGPEPVCGDMEGIMEAVGGCPGGDLMASPELRNSCCCWGTACSCCGWTTAYCW